MASVRDAYGRCSSYHDTGIASWSPDSSSRETYEVRFKTYFLRPNYLRFEWQRFRDNESDGPNCHLLTNGERSCITSSKMALFPNPSSAIAAAGDYSLGAADLVAVLLMTKVRLQTSKRSLFDLVDLNCLDEEELNSKPYYVLTGQDRKPEDQRLWISKHDYAIRKVCVDFYTTKSEYVRRALELTERERLLATKLNRTPQLPEPAKQADTHCLWHYEYTKVDFDLPLELRVFDLEE